jgi:hypothetical protein
VKLAVTTVIAMFAAFAAFVIATSCAVQHRSQDFACTTSDQCATGRMCINGFCVDNSPADAAKDDGVVGSDGKAKPDAAVSCPPQCTSCDVATKVCTIDCNTHPAICAAEVVCPIDYTCNIECNAGSACSAGVNCAQAKACTLECSGKSSCSGVMCGPGACTVTCSGSASCAGNNGGDAINCSSSCACSVMCTGTESCLGVVDCPIGCASVSSGGGIGCQDTTANCNTCP